MKYFHGANAGGQFLIFLVIGFLLVGSAVLLISGSQLERRGLSLTETEGDPDDAEEASPFLNEGSSPPVQVGLSVNSLGDGPVGPGRSLLITGATDSGARVTVNRLNAAVDPATGSFQVSVLLRDGVNPIRVSASRKGMTTNEITFHVCLFGDVVDAGCDSNN